MFHKLQLYITGTKTDLECTVTGVKGNDRQIKGKWKLVKGSTVFYNPRTVDYSCDEVIYNFKSNGTLVITSDTEDLISLPSGEYPYILTRSPIYEGIGKPYTVKINSLDIACSISNGIMILDNSRVDAPILEFVRIEK